MPLYAEAAAGLGAACVTTVSARDRLPPIPKPSTAAHAHGATGVTDGAKATSARPNVVRPTDSAIHGRMLPDRCASTGMASALTTWVALNTASSRPACWALMPRLVFLAASQASVE